MEKGLETCKYEQVIYDRCNKPLHSVPDSLTAVGYAVAVMYVIQSLTGSLSVLITWPVYTSVWFSFRYEYTLGCTGIPPLMPLCTVRDIQLIAKHTVANCFCKTTLAQGLVKAPCECGQPVTYNTCPKRDLPYVAWAPLQLLAFVAPEPFKWLFGLPGISYARESYPEIQTMIDRGNEPLPIDKSCSVLYSPLAFAVLTAMPILIAVVFALFKTMAMLVVNLITMAIVFQTQ